MMSEGERPRSSWQSWVRSTSTRRTAADEPPPPPPPPPPDSLDVDLQWGASGGAEAAPADDLDVELSWQETDESSRVLGSRAGQESSDDEAADDDTEVEVEAGFEPDEAALGDDGHDEGHDDGELLPAVPLLPSIAGRVEALSGLLRSISMRLDGLTAVTDVYRANVTDRIDEYTETVLQLSRQSDQTLDEHRRANERAISELRRNASDRGEAVGQLVGRVEELATDVATLRELVEVMIDTMPASAEGSGAAPLTRGDLDDVVGAIADSVVDRIDVGGLVDAVVARMEAAFEVVDDSPSSSPASSPTKGPDVLDNLTTNLTTKEPDPAPKRGRGRKR